MDSEISVLYLQESGTLWDVLCCIYHLVLQDNTGRGTEQDSLEPFGIALDICWQSWTYFGEILGGWFLNPETYRSLKAVIIAVLKDSGMMDTISPPT